MEMKYYFHIAQKWTLLYTSAEEKGSINRPGYATAFSKRLVFGM